MRRFFKAVGKDSLRASLQNAAFWWLTLLYLETVLHVQLFGRLSLSFLYAVGFTGVIALLISGLLGFLGAKANKVVSLVAVCVLSVVYCTQIVYDAAFGTMYSVSQIAMGGAAVTSFWRETLLTILEVLPVLALMLLPIPVTALLLKRASIFQVSRDWLRIAVIVAAVLLQLATVGCLTLGGTGNYSAYDFYYNDRATTDQAAEHFGLLTTMRLEFFTERSPEEELQEPIPEFELPEPIVMPDATQSTEPAQPFEYGYNTLEIDFDKLNALTDDKEVLALNQYIASLTGTKQNEYTGMLADYNLITLCAESFSAAAIDKELTPTLYKLVNEGFVFSNFYNSYPNNTTDGEYSFCLGLWPDTRRDKDGSSFYASRGSYLPYALGNIFKEQRGVNTYAYHNYSGSYYGRDESHPNMGYACKFAKKGMTFTSSWPSSDLEMMEQSVGDYIQSGQQFHAYYMTFSGHISYNTSSNDIAARNYHMVKDLPYSEQGKCYLSCNIELDKALAYLMDALESAGILDKTAIVLAADHHPYGLKDQRYAELLGHPVDDANKYEAPLIFWVGGMEEPVYVDSYMCSIDILPTILNLWGFSYDSRLLAGRDIFSDAEHMAVLRDQSFFTDKVWFNASTAEATWLVDESTVDPDYLEKHIAMVKNQFAFSSSILNTAYYNFLFEKGDVKVNDQKWREEKPADDTQETPEGGTGEIPEGGAGETPEGGTGEIPEGGAGETPEGGTGETPEGGAEGNPEDAPENETVPA